VAVHGDDPIKLLKGGYDQTANGKPPVSKPPNLRPSSGPPRDPSAATPKSPPPPPNFTETPRTRI